MRTIIVECVLEVPDEVSLAEAAETLEATESIEGFNVYEIEVTYDENDDISDTEAACERRHYEEDMTWAMRQ